jgi:hypothetical protein
MFDMRCMRGCSKEISKAQHWLNEFAFGKLSKELLRVAKRHYRYDFHVGPFVLAWWLLCSHLALSDIDGQCRMKLWTVN